METDSNEINMESSDLIPSEWHEKFLTLLKEEKELEIAENKELYGSSDFEDNNNNDNDTNDDDDDDKDETDYDNTGNNDDDTDSIDKYTKKEQEQCDLLCKDEKNEFLSSCFTNYKLQSNENNSVDEIHEKTNDLKYLLNLCGFNLTCLDLSCYPTSQLMPIINANCPNLWSLALGFREITSQDFENCFSNMSHVQRLTIDWECKNSTLPMTLAKSLEQISGTLKSLELSCYLQGNDIFSPDSLASVFPRLIALKRLKINELLINICNNNRKLNSLHITGTNITDIGMSAINNLKQLLTWLNISDCINITDKSVLKLVENLPNLADLSIKNTKVTREAVEKICESRKQRNELIDIHYSSKNDD
ncbi:hybrid signal transduction histidine kinase E-like [Aphidius gifuensis]|uniref:hybrid signal transduction histidine kinase E-like n=1 Tax=Aphidius gifuensis TaxID=684658 RepID=UPI001CDD4FB7|nr:hybrid signal transduction histidine kinase E-like [Aphidius gifuensis]